MTFYQVHKQLVDVVKNPDYNRFQFDEVLPGYKDRSCLGKVKIILIDSCKFVNIMIINAISNYVRETFNIQALNDFTTCGDMSYITRYKFDSENPTFAQIKETGVLAGSENNIFISVGVDEKTMKLLEDNSQIGITLSLRGLHEHAGSSRTSSTTYSSMEWELSMSFNQNGTFVPLYSTDADVEGYMKFMADVLVDKGCK